MDVQKQISPDYAQYTHFWGVSRGFSSKLNRKGDGAFILLLRGLFPAKLPFNVHNCPFLMVLFILQSSYNLHNLAHLVHLAAQV